MRNKGKAGFWVLTPLNYGNLPQGTEFAEYLKEEYGRILEGYNKNLIPSLQKIEPKLKINEETAFDYLQDHLHEILKIEYESALNIHLYDIIRPFAFKATKPHEKEVIKFLDAANISFYVVTREWSEPNVLELGISPFDADCAIELNDFLRTSFAYP